MSTWETAAQSQKDAERELIKVAMKAGNVHYIPVNPSLASFTMRSAKDGLFG
jgi:hypothetical protein